MADRGIADESLQFCAFERTRQDFALREAAQGRRVADGSAKFNTDLECLQIGGFVEGGCVNVGRGKRSGSRETNPPPAGGSARRLRPLQAIGRGGELTA